MKQLLLILLLSLTVWANDKVEPTMNVKDSTYEISYTFETTLSDDQIYDILLQFEHVKNYLKKPVLTIELLEEAENSNRINYHYNYLVAHLDIQMNREIDPVKREVSFEQHSYVRSKNIIPMVASSHGYYSISDKEERSEISYFQTATFDREVSWIFRRVAQKETRGFLEDLIEYIRDAEEDMVLTQK